MARKNLKGLTAILAGRLKEDEDGRRVAEVLGQEVERLNRVVTELPGFRTAGRAQEGDLLLQGLDSPCFAAR